MQVRNYNYKKVFEPNPSAMPCSIAPSRTGDKYGFMNKIMEVHEDGKLIAKMEYHGNGQLAEVRRADGVELFDWDGLALINRSYRPTTESSATAYSNTYINEHAVTGGNPILSNDTVMFNDMLGSTYAANSNGNITSIESS